MSGGNSAQLAETVVPGSGEGQTGDAALAPTVVRSDTGADQSDSLNLGGQGVTPPKSPIAFTDVSPDKLPDISQALLDGPLTPLGKGGQATLEQGSRNGSPTAFKSFLSWQDLIREYRILLELERYGKFPKPRGLFRETEGKKRLFMELERIAGTDWSKSPAWKSSRVGVRDPRAIKELVNTYLKVVEAVAQLHQCGVIHRDLKPSNIMQLESAVDQGNRDIRVIDFGMARSEAQKGSAQITTEGGIEERKVGDGNTVTGTLSGTPQYMAPEQTVQGVGAQHSKATDVYSLGAILYDILNGRSQVDGLIAPDGSIKNSELKKRLQGGHIPQIDDAAKDGVSRFWRDLFGYPELVAICKKAMSVDQNARYPSAEDMLRDLNNWREERSVHAYRDYLGKSDRGILYASKRGSVAALCADKLIGNSWVYGVRNWCNENPKTVVASVVLGLCGAALGGAVYKSETNRAAAVARVGQDVTEILTGFKSELSELFGEGGIAGAPVEIFDRARNSGAAEDVFAKALRDLSQVDFGGVSGKDLAAATDATKMVLRCKDEFQNRAAKRDEALAVLGDVRAKMIPVSFLGGNISATFPELSFGAVTGLLQQFFPEFERASRADGIQGLFVELGDRATADAISRIKGLELTELEKEEIRRDLSKGLLVMGMSLPRTPDGAFTADVTPTVLKNCADFVRQAGILDGYHEYASTLLKYRLAKAQQQSDLEEAYLQELIKIEDFFIKAIEQGYLPENGEDLLVAAQSLDAIHNHAADPEARSPGLVILEAMDASGAYNRTVIAFLLKFKLGMCGFRAAMLTPDKTLAERVAEFKKAISDIGQANYALQDLADPNENKDVLRLSLALRALEYHLWFQTAEFVRSIESPESIGNASLRGTSQEVRQRGFAEDLFRPPPEAISELMRVALAENAETTFFFQTCGEYLLDTGKHKLAAEAFNRAVIIEDRLGLAGDLNRSMLARSLSQSSGNSYEVLKLVERVLGEDNPDQRSFLYCLSALGGVLRQGNFDVPQDSQMESELADLWRRAFTRLVASPDGLALYKSALKWEGMPTGRIKKYYPNLFKELNASSKEEVTTSQTGGQE